ncbi:hypothetical protein DFP72DRAFT_754464, partial [Ephemerocybe angulata]
FYSFERAGLLCSRFITHLFFCPHEHPTIRREDATLPRFIAHVIRRSSLHRSVTFFALLLINRLKMRYPSCRGSSGHRLFIAAMMIASKVLHDETYANSSWAVVTRGFFTLREINQMEREMCRFLEWELTIDGPRLAAFERAVVAEFS